MWCWPNEMSPFEKTLAAKPGLSARSKVALNAACQKAVLGAVKAAIQARKGTSCTT
jgi:hypothetical protein